MKKIDESNFEAALNITQSAFAENRSMLWFVKNTVHKQKRLRALCGYCIRCAANKGGAFMSSDGNGVLFCYISDRKMNFIRNFIFSIRFLFQSGNWCAFPRLYKRQHQANRIRGKERHIYVMLIASNQKRGKETVLELKEFLFNMSEYLQLPIYAEASQISNKTVYERYGFKTYQETDLPGGKVHLWFLKKQIVNART